MTTETALDIAGLAAATVPFHAKLQELKAEVGKTMPGLHWYQWGSLGNFACMDRLLTDSHRDLLALADGRPIADIGGADGDVAFFLASLGCEVDLVDHGPTNMNGLHGARALRDALGSSVVIHDVDLDSQFQLPREDYGLVLFLGILYHLKNPYYALERLARAARHCVLSTRVARVSPDKGTRFEHLPMAYLLDERECNDDPTNFWIFTEPGLRRLVARTGWEVLDYLATGDTTDSDPSSVGEHDERAFCLLRSRVSA